VVTALATLLALAALWPAPAVAAPPRHRGDATPHSSKPVKRTPVAQGKSQAEPPQLTSPGEVNAGTPARDLGDDGQVDPLSGLGIRNPVCDQLAQIRDRQTRLGCEASGTPEGDYPAANYGFDIFITTGLTHPVGDILYAFATVLNGIWLGLLFVLKLVLALLGLAFGLNPFSEGQAMSQISAALGRLYERVTDPWLSTLVVCAGIWFAYKGLLRREAAAGVAGTLAAIAMLIVGLWVIHQPRETVGRLAGLADEAALGVISAPQSGSVARPAGTYAEAMSGTWSRLVEVPFAGLDFSDVSWALGPPPPEAVQKADEKFCDDVGALAVLALYAHYGNGEAKEACAAFARKRYGKPKRVIDLYLRSSPGSPARQALWDYFNGDERYEDKVAAQGGDGVLTRLSMLALFALGLLGALMLLAWLAIRLFTQAAIAFALLLAAPFALFFPLLGDSGRRAFKTWGLTLLGATLAKVIYAAFLSVVLLGIAILGHLGGPGESATGFLLSAAFAWSVFLKRAELVGWLSIGEADGQARLGVAPSIAAFAIARRLKRTSAGTVAGAARRTAHWYRTQEAERGEATRATAEDSLRGRARALADTRYGEARRIVAEFEARRGAPERSSSLARGSGRDASASARSRQAGAQSQPSAAEQTRYEHARELVGRAERNRSRGGERWSERDLEPFGVEDAELLRSSRDPAEHAHRIGMQRAEFEALSGPERERATERIEQETKRDRRRLEVASEVPGRIVGRRRQTVEGARQRIDGTAGERREHLRRLRRERRAAQLPVRRNLSRGA
jgi:hypothetical protein